MKNKHFLSLIALIISVAAYAQTTPSGVGINTTTPAATLDVMAKEIPTTETIKNPEGIIAPRLTLQDLVDAKTANAGVSLYGQDQTGAIVYVTDATPASVSGSASGQTYFITKPGYYYYDDAFLFPDPDDSNDPPANITGAWRPIGSGESSSGDGDFWSLIGNAGTNPHGDDPNLPLHFIGTTDPEPLMFRINGDANATDEDPNSIAGYIGSLTTDENTNAFGLGALKSLISENIVQGGNNAFGRESLANLYPFGEKHVYNTAMGTYAGSNIFEGNDNTAMGYMALQGATGVQGNLTVEQNTAIGSGAMKTIHPTTILDGLGNPQPVGVTDNTAVGYNALSGSINGDFFAGIDNTVVGSGALSGLEVGSSNIAIGKDAGNNLIGNGFDTVTGEPFGNSNIIIGSGSNTTTPTSSYELNIGNVIYGTNMYHSTLGLTPARIGIGTDSSSPFFEPTATLDVYGSVRVRDIQPGGINEDMVVTDSFGNLHRRPTTAPPGDAWYESITKQRADDIDEPIYHKGNVGIGDFDAPTANPAASLDVLGTPGTAQGIIAPRVTLAELNTAQTAGPSSTSLYGSAQDGAIVYVTDITGTPTGQTGAVTATGYYFLWNTNTVFGEVWMPIDGSDDWKTTGNTGINSLGGTANYLGTINSEALLFKVNSANTTDLAGQIQPVNNNLSFGRGALTAAGIVNTNNNSAFGTNALRALTNGGSNSAFGTNALAANTVGSNSAFGYNALAANNTGTNNNAFGDNALAINTTGSNNSAFGNNALATVNKAATDDAAFASNNSAFGSNALSKTTTGARNVAFGVSALLENTTGNGNSAFGMQALEKNTVGTGNTGIGRFTMQNNTEGLNNTAVGFQSMLLNSTGDNNVAMGWQSLWENTTGNNNVAVGYVALGNFGEEDPENTDPVNLGDANTAVGYGAGYNVKEGGSNTFIGTRSYAIDPYGSNQLNIAQTIYGTNMGNTDAKISIRPGGNLVLPDSSDPTFPILNLQRPSENFDVQGTTRIRTLPTNETANSIYTAADGTISATKNQIFSADQVVLADINGVLGKTSINNINANDWHLTGNSGTNPANNFLGTTDDNPLVFKVAPNIPAYGSGRSGYISNKVDGSNSFGLGALISNVATTTASGIPSTDGATAGLGNNAFGTGALSNNTNGDFNNAFGNGALSNNLLGGANNAFGNNVLAQYVGTAGANGIGRNTAMGDSSMYFMRTGTGNIAMGAGALQGNPNNNTYTGVNYNTALGTNAMLNANTGAERNVALGYVSLGGSTNTTASVSGDGNTAIGTGTMSYISTGSNNIALGLNAGKGLTTGSNNIVIGSEANVVDNSTTGFDVPSATGNNQLRIAGAIYGTSIYSNTIGTTDPPVLTNTAMVGIGVNNPNATLDVNGTARVRNMPDGGEVVVTADGDGNLFTKSMDGFVLGAANGLHPVDEGIIYLGGHLVEPTIITTGDELLPNSGVFNTLAIEGLETTAEQGSAVTMDTNGVLRKMPIWFYLPSFNLDISALGQKTVNLYDVYSSQFTNIGGTDKFVATGGVTLNFAINNQPLYDLDDLIFVVTDYDDTIITVDSIDTLGVMTYTVLSGDAAVDSYINIICVVK